MKTYDEVSGLVMIPLPKGIAEYASDPLEFSLQGYAGIKYQT
jgi:hypothetical protein